MSFYRWLFVVSCLWTIAIVGPKLSSPWAWDDLTVVAYNEALSQPGAWTALVTPRYFEAGREFSWRPASTALHVLGTRLFGKAPAGHRALEILLHLLAACLLVLAFRRWGLGEEASWVAGALFVLHPLHLETLFCVSFNEEILVLLFLTLAWLCRMDEEGKDPARRAWLSSAFFLAALLAKETALLGLPVLWVLERVRPARQMCGSRPGPGDRRPGTLASWLPHLLAFLAYGVMRFWLLRGPEEGAGFPVSPPFMDRVYFAGQSLWTLLRLVLLPFPLRIEYFAVPAQGGLDRSLAAAGWFLSAGLLGAAWRFRKEIPAAAAGLLWAALLFLPALNLLPTYALTTRFFAERWAYVPLAGLLLSAAAVCGRFDLASRKARWTAVVFVAWLACWGGLQARLWTDETRLWSRLVETYPWSAKAREGLGQAYFRNGEYGRALASFEQGLRLRRRREDRLLAYYIPLFETRLAGRGQESLPLDWESASCHRWLGRAWLALGRNDLARPEFQEAEALSARGR